MPSSFFAIPAAALAGFIVSLIGYLKYAWPLAGTIAFGVILIICIVWFAVLFFK